MPRSAIAFSSNEQRSKPLDAARLVNLFPEQPPLGARAPSLTIGQNNPLKVVLYGTPGQTAFATCGSGNVRAKREALGYMWVLVDSTLYRVDSTGTVTTCTGDVIDASGTAMMSDNGIQLVVLANGSSYVSGSAVATFSFRITGGDATPGTNKVSSVTVNAVTITSAAVDWLNNNEQTAANIAANINANVSAPDYTASANGDTVTIFAAAGTGTGPNGFAVVVTLAGSVTATPFTSATTTTGSMAGGSANSTTVAKITDSAYPSEGASWVAYLDGYIIWGRATTRQFFLSALYDATSLNASDFASAESTPATLEMGIVSSGQLWLLKDEGLEVWADVGGSPFPFQRIPGAIHKRGTAAARSPVDIDGTLIWLGDDLVIYTATGYTPKRISEHWLEEIIRDGASHGIVSDAFGLTYTQGGHKFYIITFPTMDRSFAYDITADGWHERQSDTSVDPAAWGANTLCTAFGKSFVGTSGGMVNELDLDAFTDNGDAIRRVAVTPPLYNDGKLSIQPTIEIECETGVGLTTGQGSDPQVMLRWSDDGGATWSNERRKSLGLTGVRKNRVKFDRLGSFRQRMFEISISDPVSVAAYGIRFEGVGLVA